MKVSYNWLKSLVPDLTATPAELASNLSEHSVETTVDRTIAIDPKVLVAHITKLEPHPNADRLRLATITTGTDTITVVCGAPNISEGDYVPYSPPGTQVYDDQGHPFVLREAKIRGVSSPGMLNSMRELGLSQDHGGIWLLPKDLTIGTSLASLVPADTVLDIELTPNRAHDLFCHIGVAREIAALYELDLIEPDVPKLPAATDQSSLSVALPNPELSSRYIGVLVDNLHVGISPLWLQLRLLAAGGRPLNSLIDITNYVMFEYGNPTHIFDANRLPGLDISVRPARSGETMQTLDTTEISLIDTDLVVTAHDEPVALAGVMGGLGSEVSEETTQGVLEVANFQPFSVQETARRHGVRTEASQRFSKHIHPDIAEVTARRAIQLLQEIGGATVRSVADTYPSPLPTTAVSFNPARVRELVGVDIREDQIRSILQRLRFGVDDSKVPWQITVPADRLDIQIEADVVEEVGRIYGYNHLQTPEQPLVIAPQSLPATVYWREVVRDVLVKLGGTEMYNASFEPAAMAKLVGVDGEPHIEVANPPAPDLSRLRVSLLPGLLQNIQTNREAMHRTADRKDNVLFEIGNVYQPGEGKRVPGVIETEHLAVVIVGNRPTIADIIRSLEEALGVSIRDIQNALTPDIVRKLKFRVPVTGFTLPLEPVLQQITAPVPPTPTLEELRQQPETVVMYTPISKFPAAYRDISIAVDQAVTKEQVQDVIQEAGQPLLTEIDLFDTFQLTDGKQTSLAFHLTYNTLDHTLTTEEVEAVHNRVIQALEAKLNAVLR